MMVDLSAIAAAMPFLMKGLLFTVQITLVAPRPSTADNFLTSARALASCPAARAREGLISAGKPCGIIEAAIPMANKKASLIANPPWMATGNSTAQSSTVPWVTRVAMLFISRSF